MALGIQGHPKHDVAACSNFPRRLRKGFPGDDWGEFWPLVALGAGSCCSSSKHQPP